MDRQEWDQGKNRNSRLAGLETQGRGTCSSSIGDTVENYEWEGVRQSPRSQPDRILLRFQKQNSEPDTLLEEGRPSVVSAVCKAPLLSHF